MQIPDTSHLPTTLTPMSVPGRFKLANVMVNWPSLFDFRKGDDGSYFKCGIQPMLDKERDAAIIEQLQNYTRELCEKKNNKRDEGTGRGMMLPASKIFLMDGDDKEDATYHGKVWWHCNAKYDKEAKDADGEKLPTLPRVLGYFDPTHRVTDPQEEPRIYSGCRVNLLFEIYYMHSPVATIGRMVNNTLISLQFAGNGEPLSAGHVTDEAAQEGFEGAAMTPAEGGFGEEAGAAAPDAAEPASGEAVDWS